jgi:DNA-binding beta-propeller fold protein YncE
LLRPLWVDRNWTGAASLRPYVTGFAVALFSLCSASAQTPDQETVGRHAGGRVVLPVNQVITPAGKQVELPGMRAEALLLSPDGKLLVVSGLTSELLVLDPATGATKQRIQLPKLRKGAPPDSVSAAFLDFDGHSQVSYNGLAFAPDGKRLALSNVNGDIKLFEVAKDGVVKPWRVVALPDAKAPQRKAEIPAGLAFSADGKRLYVCGNLSNRLLEIEVDAGKMRKTYDVGVAPFGVVAVGHKLYVSNWGGRRPGPQDVTGPAGRGTVMRVDPERFIASEGSVTVLDLATGQQNELVTGLHASALAVSPDGRYVVCANAMSDNLSVIATATDTLVETIWAKPSPGDLLGASPNALAFAPDGRTLYVANGTQNAVAVIHFEPADKESKLLGLIPVGWYPDAVCFDARRQQLCVANLKGITDAPRTNGFNSKQFQGTVSLVLLPTPDELPRLSQVVWDNLRQPRIAATLLPPRPGQPPRAIPERIGEPSLIKHVVYIIKENRTYDQVLGDVAAGNGNAQLCTFGERITPNQHKLVREFTLLDNTCCAGILSADGHQWTTSAFGTDYIEKSFCGWPRSYPFDDNDALAYTPSGFIWDNTRRHGISFRNYGEAMDSTTRWRDANRKGKPGFHDCYEAWRTKSDTVVFGCTPNVASLGPVSPSNTVGWALAVPDQFRADYFLRELQEFEARGEFPQFVILYLPNDHTSGTKRDVPTPAAMVADNDLAMGRVIEGLSRSRFWMDTAVFAIEDDPQAGYDHITGYRTTVYVAGPHVKRHAVISTQYNTTSLLRTMEQILGLPPMNQFDASAVPMSDCFTDTPDLAPFVAVANQVPLDQMNGDTKAALGPQRYRDMLACAKMDFSRPDKAPEDALNRILWRAMRGDAPYPEWATTAVRDED